MSVKKHFHLLTFAAGLLAGIVVMSAVLSHNRVNERALAPLTVYDSTGKAVTLDDYRGSVVLVNLWATWCPPCVAELPSLDLLQAQLHNQNFKVVAISLDRGGWADVNKFMAGKDFSHITVLTDNDRQVPLKWHYDGLPTSFLIDRDGSVVKQYNGAYKWDEAEISGPIRILLAQKGG